jgi:ABC-type transport system substrate-binding protein
MIMTDAAQMTGAVNLQDALEAEKRGIKIDRFAGAFNVRVHFGGTQSPQHSNDPWADVRVRKAIALAIDTDAMIDELWGGLAAPLGTQWPTTAIRLDAYPYDLDEAKRLLAEAGYPNGFPVEVPMVTIGGSPRVPQEHQALLLSLENLGLQVKGTVADWSSWKKRWYAGDHDGLIWAFSVTSFETPTKEWTFYTSDDANKRYTIYTDSTVEGLFTNNLATYIDDPHAYQKVEADFHQHMHDTYGTVPLYSAPELHLLAPQFSWPFTMDPQYVRLDLLQYNP